ncbi:MAG: alginate export family protein [Candidatus Wallbacteria bacterium]|nr:alginate export family protein [Candidatus Wallbacteria bacterium]
MRRLTWVLSLLLLGTAGLTPVRAQAVQEQLRRIELQTAQDPLQGQWVKKEEGQKTFQWGGWNSYSALWLKDDDNSRATADAVQRILINDSRLWGRVEFEDGSSFYGRLRWLQYGFDMGPGAARPVLRNEKVDLDLAYYDTHIFDDYSLRIGRQYIREGRGITLNGNFDGLSLDWNSGRWSFNTFLVKSLTNDPDIDANVVDPNRYYASGNVSYLNDEGERYFGYYLQERDNSDQVVAFTGSPPIGLDYDANYYALGTSGDFTQNLSYYGEGIMERGSVVALVPANKRIDINAAAAYTELAYHPNWRGHPVFTSEYAVGGGDSSRLPGINTFNSGANGVDGNFLGFGRYDFGIALNPRLSNLEIIRAGVSWRPWESSKGLETLTIGGKASRYRKNDPLGAISDQQATVANDDIGSGLDLYVGWKPWSDLTVLAQWGKFSPGDAYPAGTRDDTSNLFLNVTYSY